MGEVGLAVFAQVAMKVSAKALPPYRSKFSKQVFTQPQLVSILCLMRYADRTFREAEVRLREHSELRKALGLTRVPGGTWEQSTCLLEIDSLGKRGDQRG